MESTSRLPTSKRRYERIVLEESPVQVFKLGLIALLNSRTDIGRKLVDLSEVGVKVTLSQRLPVGTRIKIVAKIPKFADTIEGELAVKWCAGARANAEEFFAGAEFTSMPAGQVLKIQQLRKVFRSTQFRQKLATQVREKREADPGAGLDVVHNPNA